MRWRYMDYKGFWGATDDFRQSNQRKRIRTETAVQCCTACSVNSVRYWPFQCQWWRKRDPLSARLLSPYQPPGSCWPVTTKRETWEDLNSHPRVQCEHFEVRMYLNEAAEQATSRQGSCQRPPEDSWGTRWHLHRVGNSSCEILHPLRYVPPLQASIASN